MCVRHIKFPAFATGVLPFKSERGNAGRSVLLADVDAYELSFGEVSA